MKPLALCFRIEDDTYYAWESEELISRLSKKFTEQFEDSVKILYGRLSIVFEQDENYKKENILNAHYMDYTPNSKAKNDVDFLSLDVKFINKKEFHNPYKSYLVLVIICFDENTRTMIEVSNCCGLYDAKNGEFHD